MNTLQNLKTAISMALLTTFITGCGGGGGGDSAPSNTTGQTTTQQATPADTTSQTQTTSDSAATSDSNSDAAMPELNYEPEAELLQTTATDSTDLYVEPDFKFRTSDDISLELDGQDVFGESLAGRAIKVYSFSMEVPSVEDELMGNKQLIATLRFNAAGQLQHTLTVPQTTQTMLIRVDGMLETNQVLFKLDSSTSVTHTFN
ncbi:hypothetical protein A7985_22015 [Pseudoalteromonas luteoviolacea]|uniref:Uncharacterized protein n=1 Tax=Pseudoalteromonas luteoviolacea TaxID=43657 RepID=A0A1C0TK00_9GAMM|nr:hypothetical protein [Pseudoalteromonas luteoviolacea]MBQ4814404.1 hypothetical protein [Pseudoalteromonas luteoviolacea]OCQ18874.1 hypothetical protein A7985_22015 [Pseudoalteromonas luteoviolacea]